VESLIKSTIDLEETKGSKTSLAKLAELSFSFPFSQLLVLPPIAPKALVQRSNTSTAILAKPLEFPSSTRSSTRFDFQTLALLTTSRKYFDLRTR